uniref:Pectin acetylesterase n=1 Tax=Aegilops tauschii subsp. strangulata TaxID=200361 RepID=A0A453MAV2_AEGTS
EEKAGMAKLWAPFLVVLVLAGSAQAAADRNMSRGGMRRLAGAPGVPVPITVLTSAVAMGAVCMDGSPPAYHMDGGYGAGKNRWIVHLEGGSWCESVGSCLYRKVSRLGSSNLMNRQMYFGGILSSSPAENPDFFSWNRVMIRYCDGASFAGEGYDARSGLFFRGQRIWNAVIQHLLSMGMSSADHVLLTGSSAGALAVVLHCDQFAGFFAGRGTTVKCLADAGFFLDAVNVAGWHTLRTYFGGVVATHGVAQNLPRSCTSHLDATSCFFPQNVIGGINTPIFLLNAAYDTWQIRESLAPDVADPGGAWRACKSSRFACNAFQMNILQAFRNQMVGTVLSVSRSRSNGFFINSCFTHGQSEYATWNAYGSPNLQNKAIWKSVGDWYFGRAEVRAIDCAYPCDNSCHHDIRDKYV